MIFTVLICNCISIVGIHQRLVETCSFGILGTALSFERLL